MAERGPDETKQQTHEAIPTENSGNGNASVLGEEVEVKEKPHTSTSASNEDKLEKATALKEEGNERFKSGDYKAAMRLYHHALLHVKGLEKDASGHVLPGMKSRTLTKSQRAKQLQTQLTCYNNLSVCLLKQERWDRVVTYASQALEIQTDGRSKPLYRRGTAYLALGNLDGADADLKQAHSLSPGDPAIKQQLALLAEKMKAFHEREKKMYAGMFDRKSKDSNKSD